VAENVLVYGQNTIQIAWAPRKSARREKTRQRPRQGKGVGCPANKQLKIALGGKQKVHGVGQPKEGLSKGEGMRGCTSASDRRLTLFGIARLRSRS